MPETEYFLAVPALLFFVMAFLAKTRGQRRRFSLVGCAVLVSLISHQATVAVVRSSFAVLAVLLAILAILVGRDEGPSVDVPPDTSHEQ